MRRKDRVPAPRERPGGNASIGLSKRSSTGPSNFGSAGAPQTSGHQNAGWVIISYLVAGMLLYGGLGWLIGHWAGSVAVAMMIGMLVGLALALTLVYFRYGRS